MAPTILAGERSGSRRHSWKSDQGDLPLPQLKETFLTTGSFGPSYRAVNHQRRLHSLVIFLVSNMFNMAFLAISLYMGGTVIRYPFYCCLSNMLILKHQLLGPNLRTTTTLQDDPPGHPWPGLAAPHQADLGGKAGGRQSSWTEGRGGEE